MVSNTGGRDEWESLDEIPIDWPMKSRYGSKTRKGEMRVMAKAKPDKVTSWSISILSIFGIGIGFLIPMLYSLSINVFVYFNLSFGIITAIIGGFKNRNIFAWFAIGIWTMFIGLIVILFMPKLYEAVCPYCQKGISDKAIICPYCQSHLREMQV